MNPIIRLAICLTICALTTITIQAQNRPATGFQGEWNWAVYAKDKSELPPAYQSMEVSEVPAYALDVTIRRKGSRLTGSFGLLARYLARVDEGTFSAQITGNKAIIKLKSNFGGSATVSLQLKGNSLVWKRIRSTGQNFFPDDVTLRRLKPGEKLPYVAEEPEWE
jgi:hypothetical protein